jgi:hypothetical protein
LTSAGIRFTRIDIDDYSSFNFYVPRELNDFNLKGLDDKILTATEIEASSIFEAYSNSDGHLPRESNTLIIYSAKENEIDLLQAMFSQNGYHTNKFSRHHGFGNKLQHQLSVTKKNQVLASTKFIKTEDVTNEQFWCVKTSNKTWVMRRNGVVQITGNCHGNYEAEGKILDVGLDSAYNLFGEHKYLSLKDVSNFMDGRSIVVKDHHVIRKGD